MRYYFIPVILLFFISGCKKDNTDSNVSGNIIADTIFPGNYYPAYPGSHWEYIVNSTDTVTDQVSSGYVYKSYYDGETDGIPNAYIPYVNSAPIYRYYTTMNTAPFGPICRKFVFLSENVGDVVGRIFVDPRTGGHQGELMTVWQKTVNANLDSIIILKGYPNGTQIKYWQYAKNIGLQSLYRVDTLNADTLYSKELIGYFINH